MKIKLLLLSILSFILCSSLSAQQNNAFYNALILDGVSKNQLEILKSLYLEEELLKSINIKVNDINKKEIQRLIDFKESPLDLDTLPDFNLLKQLYDFSQIIFSNIENIKAYKAEVNHQIAQISEEIEFIMKLEDKIRMIDDTMSESDVDIIINTDLNEKDKKLLFSGFEFTTLTSVDKKQIVVTFNKEYLSKKEKLKEKIIEISIEKEKLENILKNESGMGDLDLLKSKLYIVKDLKELIPATYESNDVLDESVKSQQPEFKLSQAAIIDAITVYIAGKVKEALVNTVFEDILTPEIKNNLNLFFPKTIEYFQKLKDFNF